MSRHFDHGTSSFPRWNDASSSSASGADQSAVFPSSNAKPGSGDPSPETIRRRAAAVRRHWSPSVAQYRRLQASVALLPPWLMQEMLGRVSEHPVRRGA